jgi:hypothetical protein
MGYSIVDFAKSLKAERCKIRNTPNLIFLCGGPITAAPQCASARDYFHRHLKKKAPLIAQRVKLAEDVNDWFHRREVFPDLLELEKYLADLADITVLFVESPGSIAELGAFAVSDALRPKTLAVLNTCYDDDRTFISDGPVKKIKKENEKLVRYYPWNPKDLNSSATQREFRDMAKDLTDFLEARDKSHPKEQSFKKDSHGHSLLMIGDLVRIAGVVTKTDISDCLRELGCQEVQVDRYLSLLESMSFIKHVLYSDQAFYVVGSLSESFIRPAYQADAPLTDLTRIKTAIRSSLDPTRRRVLERSLRKPPKKGASHV